MTAHSSPAATGRPLPAVAPFLAAVVRPQQRGRPSIFLTCFLIPVPSRLCSHAPEHFARWHFWASSIFFADRHFVTLDTIFRLSPSAAVVYVPYSFAARDSTMSK